MIDLRIANSQLSIFYYNRENHYSWWTQSKELPLFGSLIFCYFFLRRVDDTNNFSASSKTSWSNLARTEWQNSRASCTFSFLRKQTRSLNMDPVLSQSGCWPWQCQFPACRRKAKYIRWNRRTKVVLGVASRWRCRRKEGKTSCLANGTVEEKMMTRSSLDSELTRHVRISSTGSARN